MAYVAKAERDKAEIKRLRAKNPSYQMYEHAWRYYLSAYEGGTGFIDKTTLFQHPREHDKDYQERLKRAYYENHVEPLVDFFSDFIFAQTIQRESSDDNDWYQEFLQDVNKKGDDVSKFMKEICDDMQIFGMIYVLVDTPRIPTGLVPTKADAKTLGLRPYWVNIKPLEIYDWVTDPFDNFLYVKRMQEVQSYENGEIKVVERYTEWDIDIIRVTEIDITNPRKPIVGQPYETTNKLKEVPIEVFRYRRSKNDSFLGVSFLKDLADANREILNLSSLEQEFLYRQCFNILALEAEDAIPHREQEEGETGTANAIVYPKGGKPPQYITPSADPAKYMSDTHMRIKASMYNRAAQDMVNELFNGGRASGHSKAMSFSTTVPRIANRADTLEYGERELMRLTYKFRNMDWSGKIFYKDRYEITNLTDALTQFNMLFKDLQLQSPTMLKTSLKRLADEIDGKTTPEERAKIHSEIDGMNTRDYFDTMKLTLMGRAAASPEVGTAFGQSPAKPDQHDQPAKASTPTRAQSGSKEVQAESSKQPTGAKPKNAPKGK